MEDDNIRQTAEQGPGEKGVDDRRQDKHYGSTGRENQWGVQRSAAGGVGGVLQPDKSHLQEEGGLCKIQCEYICFLFQF